MNPALAARMAEGVLRHMGQDAVLRGSTPTRASIEHGVETLAFEGTQVFLKSVVTLPKATLPKVGDTLAFVGGESFVIDGPPVHDNGFLVRHVVRKTA